MSRPRIRCAIYTRKSSDEGLDQEFNSLDAQHEACAAYVASQRREGWKLVPARFDDGGISGGTLERPALQRLLAEIDTGRIDMVVVYKIDRLTRSLADFARLVDRLEAANCSFVSVTQAFNTSSSMGRLTLNVLLSFAQFEREVTAERIRDKIAASKKKGLWMGGNLPLGYDRAQDANARTLVVNEDEAETVRRLFRLYANLGCLRRVTDAAAEEQLRSKRRQNSNGRVSGGHPLSRGQIHYLLCNPIYLGKIRHRDKVWDGQHPPIIDTAIWTEVQERLQAAATRPRRRCRENRTAQKAPNAAWLTGKLADPAGDRLIPTHTTRHGRRHCYYVSNRLISGGPDPSGWRLPGPALEMTVMAIVIGHLEKAAASHNVMRLPDATTSTRVTSSVRALIRKLNTEAGISKGALITSGQVSPRQIDLALNGTYLAEALDVATADLAQSFLRISAPCALRRRGAEMKIVAGQAKRQPDPHLRAMLIRAHRWVRALQSGTSLAEIAKREGHAESFLRTRAQLAFLSPKIQVCILEGTQPAALTLSQLVRSTLPLDWSAQEKRFGF